MSPQRIPKYKEQIRDAQIECETSSLVLYEIFSGTPFSDNIICYGIFNQHFSNLLKQLARQLQEAEKVRYEKKRLEREKKRLERQIENDRQEEERRQAQYQKENHSE